MKDYYELFVQLSLQQCVKNDYGNKEKVKAHNVASKKLQKLQKEMKQIDCSDLLGALLDYEDDRVKVNAAFLCLQMNVHREKVRQTLNEIVNSSEDSTMVFSARMALQSM